MLEVLEAVAAAVGEDRVGVRLCPYNIWMDATDTVEAAVRKNVWLMQELSRRLPGLAYVHMVRVLLRVLSRGFSGGFTRALSAARSDCMSALNTPQCQYFSTLLHGNQFKTAPLGTTSAPACWQRASSCCTAFTSFFLLECMQQTLDPQTLLDFCVHIHTHIRMLCACAG